MAWAVFIPSAGLERKSYHMITSTFCLSVKNLPAERKFECHTSQNVYDVEKLYFYLALATLLVLVYVQLDSLYS